jgi:hypothetical protein
MPSTWRSGGARVSTQGDINNSWGAAVAYLTRNGKNVYVNFFDGLFFTPSSYFSSSTTRGGAPYTRRPRGAIPPDKGARGARCPLPPGSATDLASRVHPPYYGRPVSILHSVLPSLSPHLPPHWPFTGLLCIIVAPCGPHILASVRAVDCYCTCKNIATYIRVIYLCVEKACQIVP